MKVKKITAKNLYTQIPVVGTITFWLLLDKLNVNGVVWGIFYTLSVIVWISVIAQIFTTTPTDIFKEDITNLTK